MAPACTSSHRTSPANMGSPAASAEVHPSGRSASDPSGKMAPDPAVQDEPLPARLYSSYNVQVLRLMIRAWRSLPFSTRVSAPTGDGPGSLALAYWKVIVCTG